MTKHNLGAIAIGSLRTMMTNVSRTMVSILDNISMKNQESKSNSQTPLVQLEQSLASLTSTLHYHATSSQELIDQLNPLKSGKFFVFDFVQIFYTCSSKKFKRALVFGIFEK